MYSAISSGILVGVSWRKRWSHVPSPSHAAPAPLQVAKRVQEGHRAARIADGLPHKEWRRGIRRVQGQRCVRLLVLSLLLRERDEKQDGVHGPRDHLQRPVFYGEHL